MNEHYYQIAGHLFILRADTSVRIDTLLPTLHLFDTEKKDDEPLFSFTLVKELLPAPDAAEFTRFDWEGGVCIIYTIQDGYELVIQPEDGAPERRMRTNSDFTVATAELPETDDAGRFIVNNFLMMIYAFATAPHHTLMFHASVIRRNGVGYLFLGKSGTGKSTHSNLWLRHIEGSSLLNDDNPIVRYFPDGRVMVYGSPWSGKTPCYKNEEARVGAFVRLQQAPHNRIGREGKAHAFASLLPSCSCLRQDKKQFDSICDTVTQIAIATPVYKLECLPDADAARLCFSTVTGQERD